VRQSFGASVVITDEGRNDANSERSGSGERNTPDSSVHSDGTDQEFTKLSRPNRYDPYPNLSLRDY
jgi:hypothetical protein